MNPQHSTLNPKPGAEEEGGLGVEASSQGWVVDVLLHRKGGALHCTTKSLGELGRLVLGRPGNSYVAYLVMQNGNLEYGERRCGFNTEHQTTKRSHPVAASREPFALEGWILEVLFGSLRSFFGSRSKKDPDP